MKTWNVHWCESRDLFGGMINVDAPTKREAENAAIRKLLKEPYNFVIVAVHEARPKPDPVPFMPGCHYWGGQVRNNAEWRKKW
jgi:hypothetical protein